MVVIAATIEARMSSSRLPGKVLLDAAGKPMLSHLVSRLKKVSSIDHIVLATTDNVADDILQNFASLNDISCWRGSENNVMKRVLEAAESVQADIIVEITGDCPLVDPQIVEQMIQIYLHNDVDYVSNNKKPSFPDGMDVQIIKYSSLKHSYNNTKDALDYEHVTYHIKRNSHIYRTINFMSPPATHWPDLGLTLDEDPDYQLLSKIIEHFEEQRCDFSCLDIINYLKSNPSLVSLNSEVKRKGYT